MTDREMIEARCKQADLTIQGWTESEDGDTATLGRYTVVTPDYDDDGLYEGDEGVLTACVVGAEQYGNRRVSFSFTPEGYDGGTDVRDLYALERLDDGVPHFCGAPDHIWEDGRCVACGEKEPA